MGITVDISQADQRIEGLKKNLGKKGLDKLGKEAASLLLKDARRAFDSKAAPSGYPWKQRKGNQSWPLLNQTGKVKGNARTEHQVSGSRLKVTGSLKPGVHHNGINSAGVFSIHHFGSANTVRRPIFGISKNTSQRVKETAKALVKK